MPRRGQGQVYWGRRSADARELGSALPSPAGGGSPPKAAGWGGS